MTAPVTFSGEMIRDLYTHREVTVTVETENGTQQGIVVIGGEVLRAFEDRYYGSMQNYQIVAKLTFERLGQRVQIDHTRSGDFRVGTLRLDDIIEVTALPNQPRTI